MGKGYMLVLLGTDGCGKSTIAGMLMKDMISKGVAFIHQHWRPGVLPSPRVLIGQKLSNNPARPHDKKSHSTAISFLLSLYYFFDFWMGHFFRARPFIQKGGVVIAERFIYDMVLDPLRHRLSISEKWARFLCKSAPDPELVVILTGDPFIFHQRKKEIDIQEIMHQQKKIKKFFKNYPKALFISTTDQSVETCTQRILEHIQTI